MNRKIVISIFVVAAVAVAVLFFGIFGLRGGTEEAEVNNFEKYGPVGVARADYEIVTENLPKFKEIIIDPLDVHVGDVQTFTVFFDSSSSVTEVTTITELDNKTMKLSLVKTGETADETIFSDSWEVKDTHTKTYRTKFTAWDSKGNENSVYMTWTDPCTGIVHGSTSILSVPCTVSSVDGSDSGNIIVEAGNTVTINTGGTFVWTPGYSITVNGSVAIASGGALQRGYLFYGDSDGDGSGDGILTWDAVPSSTGYVRPVDSPTTDCDSGNSYLYQNIAGLSSDNDQDGYTDTGAATRCVGASTVASNGKTYYRDSAGAYTWLTDSQKTGTSDCDDGSVSLYQNLTGYIDSDSDGYGSGSGQQICSGASLPGGYVTNGSDCNDGNGYVFQNISGLGQDIDHDRFYSGGTAARCVGGQSSWWYRGTGGDYPWIYYGSAYGSSDCDDMNSWAWIYRYPDADSDAYCASAVTSCVGNEAGYRDSCTAYSDCNDSNSNLQVYKYADADSDNYAPNASTYCVGTGTVGFNGSPAGFNDCNDNDGSVYNMQTYYADADGDGMCGGSTAQFCASSPPSGYCSTAGNDLCDDVYGVYNPSTYFRDADGDGYGNSSIFTISCGQPSGYVGNSSDCYDSNANAKPGQASYFTSDRGDGSYDYNCDYAETKQYTATGGSFSNCTTFTPPCEGTWGSVGWSGALPSCGHAGGTWYVIDPGYCGDSLGNCIEMGDDFSMYQPCR